MSFPLTFKSTLFCFRRFVLREHEADTLDHINEISLKNIVCLFFAWILIFFCLMKGIKSSGKVNMSCLSYISH